MFLVTTFHYTSRIRGKLIQKIIQSTKRGWLNKIKDTDFITIKEAERLAIAKDENDGSKKDEVGEDVAEIGELKLLILCCLRGFVDRWMGKNKPKIAYSCDGKTAVWHYGLKLQWYLTGDRDWRYGMIWYGFV